MFKVALKIRICVFRIRVLYAQINFEIRSNPQAEAQGQQGDQAAEGIGHFHAPQLAARQLPHERLHNAAAIQRQASAAFQRASVG